MPKVVGVCTIEVEPGRAGSEGKPGVSPTYRNTGTQGWVMGAHGWMTRVLGLGGYARVFLRPCSGG